MFDSPYLSMNPSRIGLSPSYTFDTARFCEDLAKLIGGTTSNAKIDTASIDLADMSIFVQAETWRKTKKEFVNVFVFPKNRKNNLHYGIGTFPSTKIDSSKAMSKIAGQVMTKLVNPSMPLIAKIKEVNAALITTHSVLLETVNPLIAMGIDCKIDSDTATTADIYYNNNGNYISGTIFSDGKLTLQRVSLNLEVGNAFLALLTKKD